MAWLGSIIRKQFGNPEGWLGYVAGWMMSVKNRNRIDWAVEVLDIKPADNILEIGCGPGVAAQLIGPELTSGCITGIDRSAVMIEMAAKRVKNFIAPGKVNLRTGLLQDMHFQYRHFNKIFLINVFMFWENPVAELQAIGKYLTDDGKFYLFHQPALTKNKDLTRQFAEKTCAIIEQAGLTVCEIKYKDIAPVPVVCIICKPGKQ